MPYSRRPSLLSVMGFEHLWQSFIDAATGGLYISLCGWGIFGAPGLSHFFPEATVAARPLACKHCRVDLYERVLHLRAARNMQRLHCFCPIPAPAAVNALNSEPTTSFLQPPDAGVQVVHVTVGFRPHRVEPSSVPAGRALIYT